MPLLTVKSTSEAPRPGRVVGVTQEQQREYESFIKAVGDNIGELHLDPDEQMRSVKARLSRAASRLGVRIERWDHNGRVYFQRWTSRRPRRRSEGNGSA